MGDSDITHPIIMDSFYNLDHYLYDLPEELIATSALEKRDACRLMVVDRSSNSITHLQFNDLKNFLKQDDQLVFNNSKVIPARLIGKRSEGGAAEVFLIESLQNDIWKALVKPGKKLQKGAEIVFSDTFSAIVLEVFDDGTRSVQLNCKDRSVEEAIDLFGEIPLPPYMKRQAVKTDSKYYQTVYAKDKGSVAAPTAGLHFTNEMLKDLKESDVDILSITLHVGLGTFLPVKVKDIRDHKMHRESFNITEEIADKLNNKKNIRQICVGTTTLRTLESACVDGKITAGAKSTDIFIYPGYTFKYVTSLLTNFHQPGSSLLMLVSAFAGDELIQKAYKEAVKEKYRFLSYGDAMLII